MLFFNLWAYCYTCVLNKSDLFRKKIIFLYFRLILSFMWVYDFFATRIRNHVSWVKSKSGQMLRIRIQNTVFFTHQMTYPFGNSSSSKRMKNIQNDEASDIVTVLYYPTICVIVKNKESKGIHLNEKFGRIG